MNSPKTLGILGGGQLGKMMLYHTQKMNIATRVLDPDPQAVSRTLTPDFVVGDWKDKQTVIDFGTACDIITLEIEHVNVEALYALEKMGKEVYPSARVIDIIQDKSKQKQFLFENQIPTSHFTVFDSQEVLSEFNHSYPFIWKKATLGYDGYGVKKIDSPKDIAELPDSLCIAEDMVDIAMEVSVMVVRSQDGTQQLYPALDMEFDPETNQVAYVHFPSEQPQAVLDKCIAVAQKVGQTLQHVGMLAVELFVTLKGEVLVNELAPRPHNSGHLTIEGFATDQFEQHVRTVYGLPQGEVTALFPYVSMANVVGAAEVGTVFYQGIEEVMNTRGSHLHIYGKDKTKPSRKLGHITLTSTEPTRKNIHQLKQTIVVKAD